MYTDIYLSLIMYSFYISFCFVLHNVLYSVFNFKHVSIPSYFIFVILRLTILHTCIVDAKARAKTDCNSIEMEKSKYLVGSHDVSTDADLVLFHKVNEWREEEKKIYKWIHNISIHQLHLLYLSTTHATHALCGNVI